MIAGPGLSMLMTMIDNRVFAAKLVDYYLRTELPLSYFTLVLNHSCSVCMIRIILGENSRIFYRIL